MQKSLIAKFSSQQFQLIDGPLKFMTILLLRNGLFKNTLKFIFKLLSFFKQKLRKKTTLVINLSCKDFLLFVRRFCFSFLSEMSLIENKLAGQSTLYNFIVEN